MLDFLKGTAAVRQTNIISGSSLPWGYTISRNVQLMLLILPTAVILRSAQGNKTPTYIGTSWNLVYVVVIVLLMGSVLVLFNVFDMA